MKYVSGRLRKLELGLSSHSETKQTLNVIGNVDITGIASASAFADFDYLQAPYGSTVSFTVTVASKSNHRYSGGSSNAYYINGVESPVLTLTPGRTYRFSNDNSGSHPLRFYYDANRTTQYTAGVNFQSTYTEITVSDTTPNVLHYQCANHALMGNSVVTNSNVVDSPYAATLRDSLTVSGNITANGNILGDNATNISGINSVTATSFFGDGSGLVDVSIPGISTAGTTELTHLELSGHLKVSGISTFGNDKVIVGGATTDLLVNGSARVTGELKVGDGTITLNSAGLSTFPTGVDVSGGSGLIASSAKISDLTSGRVVFAGTGGELEDSANLTFDGTTLTGAFSGDGSGLTGLIGAGVTNNVNTINLNVISGVSTFNNNVTLAAGNLDVDAGQLLVGSNVLIGPAGVATFSGTGDVHLKDNVRLNVGDGSDLAIYHNGSTSFIVDGADDLRIRGDAVKIQSSDGHNCAQFLNDSSVDLYFNNSKKWETTNDGAVTTGIATATLGIDAAISVWTLGASGSSHYTFTGPGNLSATSDPTLNLIRGQKYTFKNRSGGHPFRIQSTANGSTGTQYNTGVTNNDGAAPTDIVFDVPQDAPSVLYYQCTAHPNMGGKFIIGSQTNEYIGEVELWNFGAGITWRGSSGITATTRAAEGGGGFQEAYVRLAFSQSYTSANDYIVQLTVSDPSTDGHIYVPSIRKHLDRIDFNVQNLTSSVLATGWRASVAVYSL